MSERSAPGRGSHTRVVCRRGAPLCETRWKTLAGPEDQINVSETWRSRPQAGAATSVLCSIGATAAEKHQSLRHDGAANAAATMAGVEQEGEADEHDNLHVRIRPAHSSMAERTDQPALAFSTATSDPVRFSRRQRGSDGLSVVQCEKVVSE